MGASCSLFVDVLSFVSTSLLEDESLMNDLDTVVDGELIVNVDDSERRLL